MDQDIKQQLEEIHALVKDNHRMLRAIRRSQWFNFLTSIIFWAAVIILPIYLYQQYMGPIISKISAVSGVPISTDSFGISSFANIEKLLNSYTTGK